VAADEAMSKKSYNIVLMSKLVYMGKFLGTYVSWKNCFRVSFFFDTENWPWKQVFRSWRCACGLMLVM